MNMVNSASTWSSLRISRSSSLPGVAVVSFLAFERHGVDSEKITRPAGIIASLPQYCLREFPANAAVL